MRERLITFGLALAALFLFYTLMLPKPQLPQQELSQPRSTDSGSDGMAALWRWFDAQHVAVSSLRHRYDGLLPADSGPVPTGNVLITVLPHRVPMRADEAHAIRRWVAAGNTVLVLAALDDTPMWSLGLESSLLPELTDLSDMKFDVMAPPRAAPGSRPPARRPQQPARAQPVSDEHVDEHVDEQPSFGSRLQDLVKGRDIVLDAVGEHPLVDRVQTVHAHSTLPASRWRGEAQQTVPLLLLRRKDSGAPAMWLLRAGEGQVIVSSFVSPFLNEDIGRGDNAQLLSNILHWSRLGGGRVIFDDAHQGLTDYYDAKAFFGDPRLHRAIGWIVLAWLAFVLGPLPLRSAYRLWKPLDEMALVDASGRFYAVSVAPLEAARRLFENFFNRLRGRLHLPQNGAPLWEWLQTQSRLAPDQRAQLQALYSQVQAGQRVKLAGLQSLLSDIQGKVA